MPAPTFYVERSMKPAAIPAEPDAAAAPAGSLYNDDLAPTSAAQRTWRWYHFAALWVGMVMNIASYMLAAGLIQEGMSPWQAVLTVLLGNLIVLVPMLLIGHAGAKHGFRMRCSCARRSARRARSCPRCCARSSRAAGTASRPGSAAARSIRC
jgi:cytosine/uracil/thiamine/allantoin permease